MVEKSFGGSMSEKELNALREEINSIDTKLFGLIKKRLDVNYKIGVLKKTHNEPVVHENREAEIFNALKTKAETHNINKELITNIWKLLINESQNIQHNC